MLIWTVSSLSCHLQAYPKLAQESPIQTRYASVQVPTIGPKVTFFSSFQTDIDMCCAPAPLPIDFGSWKILVLVAFEKGEIMANFFLNPLLQSGSGRENFASALVTENGEMLGFFIFFKN